MAGQGARVTWETAGEGERRWFLSTPAGLDRLVRDGSVPRPSPDQLTEIFRAHGQVALGPALAPDD